MKLMFLTDNFPPEVNAPATRTFEHCKEWVKAGIDVTVVTCVPNFPEGKVYPGFRNRLYQREIMEGIKVIRVWTYMTANEGFIRRTMDYLSFMFSSFLAGLFVDTDLIIATSPQFFTAISGRWLGFWKRKPWIMEVRDLWPESIKAVGAMDTNVAIRFFEFLEQRMYNSASKIVVVTDSFKEELVHRNKINPLKIEVVKNGVNLELFTPGPKNKKLLEKYGLQQKCVIGYIGTHGMAHKLDFILDCADALKNKESFHFLFLGAGAEKINLIKKKDQLGLRNVTMLDPVAKRSVKEYISLLDIGLVNLKKSDTFKSVLPSKIFELAAMHKPILLGVEGEAKKLIEKYKVGVAFEPENTKDFIEKLKTLVNQNVVSKQNFDRLLRDFDRKALADKMLQFLKNGK